MQSITVGILWATVITVESANSALIIFCRIMSVALSMEAVASSSTKTLLFLSKARPRQNSCRCPMLQFDPSSSTEGKSVYYHTNVKYLDVLWKHRHLPRESSPLFFSSIVSLS